METIDAVLTADPPRFDEAEAAALGGACFDLVADGAVSLGSERDQTFLLTSDQAPVAVLKVSNAAERTATLDMEALVVSHIARIDPSLPVVRPLMHRAAEDPDDPLSYRALTDGDGSHWCRAYPVIAGRRRCRPSELSDRAVIAWGETVARLARAMRGFSHPSAHRFLPWDLKAVPMTRGMVPAIRNPEWRSAVEAALDRYDAVIAPRWDSLRRS